VSPQSFRILLLVVWLAFATGLHAEQGIIVLHVKDVKGQPIVGLEIGTEGDGSTKITLRGGVARIALAPQTKVGSWVSLQIVSSPKGRDLVMVSPWDGRALVPSFENESDNFVPVVVSERGDRTALESGTVLVALAARINKASAASPQHGENIGQRADPLSEIARQFGLKPEEVDQAIRAWGQRVQDPYERALAELYAKEYPAAEKDFADSLRQAEQEETEARSRVADRAAFLGETLYDQGKYAQAVSAYQEAIDHRPGDTDLRFRLAEATAHSGNFTQAVGVAQAAFAQDESRLGENNPKLAESYFELGSLYVNFRHYPEGEKYFSAAVGLLDRTLGPTQPALLRYLDNLALLYMADNRNSDAELILKRALGIQGAALDPRDPEVTYTQNTLALLYTLDGKYVDAETLLIKSFDLLQDLVFNAKDTKAPAGNIPQLMKQTIEYLVQVFDARGLNNSAKEQLLKRDVAIEELLSGKDSLETAEKAVALADLYVEQSRYLDAEPLYRRALAIEQNSDGEILSTRSRLLTVLVRLRRFPEAEDVARGSLKIIEASSGMNSPAIDDVLTELAGLFETEHKYSEAEQLLKRAVRNCDGLSDTDPQKIKASSELATFYYDRKQYTDAEMLLKTIAEKLSKSGNERFMALRIQAFSNLGVFYVNQDKFEQGQKQLETALDLAKKAGGQDSPALEVLLTLADLETARREFGRAEDYYQQALGLISTDSQAGNEVAILNKLARLYAMDKKFAEAEKAYSRAVEICEKSQRILRMSVAGTFQNQALFFMDLSRYADAEKANKQALAVAEDARWDGDPELIRFLRVRAEILRKTNKPSEAAAVEARVKALQTKDVSDE
jgi:tetratricopeptide (TPR) repeat protein